MQVANQGYDMALGTMVDGLANPLLGTSSNSTEEEDISTQFISEILLVGQGLL